MSETIESGSNCTDETKREWYRRALQAKIAAEAAQQEVNSKRGAYRNVLKEAKKAGVDSKAIATTLAVRFEDEDLLVIELREQLKMLDLAGVVPRILDKILDRFSIQEPTANEAEQMELERAYDAGIRAYGSGATRDENANPAGTDTFDAWDRGWLWMKGQADRAEEMAPPLAPTPVPQSRPRQTPKHDEPALAAPPEPVA